MAANKNTEKHYKTGFKFNENHLDYEVRLKKRKKWWLWLLLLLPLLFFFICDKEVKEEKEGNEDDDKNYAVIYSNLDLIMCIDCTGSMGDALGTVKKHALDFWPDLKRQLRERDKNVENFRIKIIAFRDYNSDGKDAMAESKFFNIPEQEKEYKKYVSGLDAHGGGDDPEHGLEAIALAINSEWLELQDEKHSHVIMVWTDVSAHELTGKTSRNYPENMPKNIEELKMLWDEKLNSSSKRLLLFAPKLYPWNKIPTEWNNAFHFPFEGKSGLSKVDYKSVIESIADFI